ncbi:unnamed protein product, partial [Discosporangium mesarthrocarpum]
MVQELVGAGADIRVNTEDGRTLLHYAFLSGYGLVVRMLLRAGAPHEIRDEAGGTAIRYAAQSGSVDAVKLLKAGAGTEESPIDGSTPLMASAEMGHHGVVKELL